MPNIAEHEVPFLTTADSTPFPKKPCRVQISQRTMFLAIFLLRPGTHCPYTLGPDIVNFLPRHFLCDDLGIDILLAGRSTYQ